MKSIEDFENLNLKENTKILKDLKEKYPEEFQETYDYLVEVYEEICNSKITCDLFNLVSVESFIEEMDDFIEEEILVNYYVKDFCPTDKGTYSVVLYNGYKLLV